MFKRAFPFFLAEIQSSKHVWWTKAARPNRSILISQRPSASKAISSYWLDHAASIKNVFKTTVKLYAFSADYMSGKLITWRSSPRFIYWPVSVSAIYLHGSSFFFCRQHERSFNWSDLPIITSKCSCLTVERLPSLQPFKQQLFDRFW